MINRRALIKNPDTITGVSFENYTLTVKTSVCAYSNGITTKTPKKNEVPGQMTIRFSAYGSNAIKVKYTHHRTSATTDNRYVDIKPSQSGSIDENEDYIIFKNNMFEARISKGNVFSIDFYYAGKYLTSSRADNGGSSYVTESGVASNYKVATSAYSYEALTTEPDEQLFGLGSNGASLPLNGKDLKLENKKAGGNGTPDYQHVPFYISTKKYGIFLNTRSTSEFSFGTEYASAVSFGVEDEELEYVIFASEDMLSVLNLFINTLGISRPVPFWSMGTSILLTDDKTVTDADIIKYVDGLKDSGIQINELWLSYLWVAPSDPLGFSFDLSRFPDPAVFCRKLHDRGIKVGVSINPYITENSEFYDECLENDLLVKTSDNTLFMRDCEFAGATILDLTNVAARSFIQQRTDALLKLGIDMVEADFRYTLFDFRDDEIAFYDGSKLSDVNNTFASLFNEAVYEAVSRGNGLANAMVISNAISMGAQLHPYTNVIPANNTFDALGSTLKRCLTLGLSGMSTVNIDTPLLTPGKDDKLFMRWIQLGFLAPHMRITLDIKTPLSSYSGIIETIKLFSNLRHGMLPLFYSINCEATTLGTPSMRPLFLDAENDLSARNATQQYMLGSQLMVIPVTCESGNVHFYVPAGVWTNLLTREKIQGPCYKTLKADSNNIPILVKPNSVIVSGSTEANIHSSILNNLTFTVFELQNGVVCASEVFSEDASSSGIINILKSGNKITVRTSGIGQNKRIVLNGIKNVVSVSESMPNVNEYGTTIDFTAQELVITLG